jgi:hypothetical protein
MRANGHTGTSERHRFREGPLAPCRSLTDGQGTQPGLTPTTPPQVINMPDDPASTPVVGDKSVEPCPSGRRPG